MADQSYDMALAQSMGRATRQKPRKSYVMSDSDEDVQLDEPDQAAGGKFDDNSDEEADDGMPLGQSVAARINGSNDDLSVAGFEDADGDEEMDFDEDAEGELDDQAADGADLSEDDDMTPPPDTSKMTKRQRGQVEADPVDDSFLQLPMGWYL